MSECTFCDGNAKTDLGVNEPRADVDRMTIWLCDECTAKYDARITEVNNMVCDDE